MNLNEAQADVEDEVLQKFSEAQEKLRRHQKIVDKYAQKFNIPLSDVAPTRRTGETRRALELINETRQMVKDKAEGGNGFKGDNDYYENKVDEVLERVKKRYKIQEGQDYSSRRAIQNEKEERNYSERLEIAKRSPAKDTFPTRADAELQRLQIANIQLNNRLDAKIGAFEREKSKERQDKDKLKSIKDNLKELKRRYKENANPKATKAINFVENNRRAEYSTPKKDDRIPIARRSAEISPVREEPEGSRLTIDHTAKKLVGEVTPRVIEVRSSPNLDHSISYTQSFESSELFRSVEKSIRKHDVVTFDKPQINEEEELQKAIDSDPVLKRLFTEKESVIQKIRAIEDRIASLAK